VRIKASLDRPRAIFSGRTFVRCLIASVCVLAVGSAQAQAATVNAADYGYDPTDATAALQAAIDSGASRVIVPRMNTDWIIRPVFLRASNQEIVFAPGVVVLAKAGAFQAENDCLFSLTGRSHVKLTGYGATLRMRKADYQNPALYSPSEHRHALQIEALVGQPVDDISIQGLRLESSGGDGLYIGGISGYPSNDPVQPKNVVIRDVICTNNHRQGISITGAENLEILDSHLETTDGTAPKSGIDWEPDWDRILHVKMINCVMYNNAVNGLLVDLHRPAWRGPNEVTLSFSHCHSEGSSGRQGIALKVVRIYDNAYTGPGLIQFDDCSFINRTIYHTLYMANKSALQVPVVFNQCYFAKEGAGTPLLLETRPESSEHSKVTMGGVAFNNCLVNSTADEPPLLFEDADSTGRGIRGLSGAIEFHNPFGRGPSLGPVQSQITWTPTVKTTRPPVVSISQPTRLQTILRGATVACQAQAHDPDSGSANGSGIAEVRFTVRRGNVALATSIASTAPYTLAWNTTGVERGLYTVKAEAVSSQHGSRAIAVMPFLIRSSGFESWRAAYFDAAELGNPALSGPAADPEADALPNLMEYALRGGNPWSPAPAARPALANSPTATTMTFALDPAATEITFTVETSPDLASWEAIATRSEAGVWSPITQVTATESSGNVTVTDQRPKAAKRSYRLRATIPG
jgi:Bacterial Ig domain